MIGDTIAFFLSACCLAFVAIAASGALFAGLTFGSRHLRWFLPLVVTLVGLETYVILITKGGFMWWQVAIAVPLLISLALSFSTSARLRKQPYIDLCLGAVIRSTSAFAGFLLIWILTSLAH
ncbi:MAG: hypothetical protein ACR2RV_25780 [Verrucomicrobiales bacterium]